MDYIARKILVELLSQETIVSSWGIENIKVNANNICFHVDGFKYCGNVCIFGRADVVDIKFKESNLLLKSIKIDNIVKTIDSTIETDEKYINNLYHWLDKILNG